MAYFQGQIVPLDNKASIIGDKMGKPNWHAVFVPPNKERSTTAALKAKGCFAFYPKRTSRWFVRGKRIEREFPQITGMIYARFKHQPHWHVMRDRRLITGVMSVGTKPIDFPSEIIRRLQGLPERADALRQARARLGAIGKGDTAIVAEGPLAGYFVQVSDVKPDGTVFWHHDLFKGQSSVGELEKEGGASEAEIQTFADGIMRGEW